MRIGAYFDGFNVYYGGRTHFGKGVAGWKWYSPRDLASDVLRRMLASSSIAGQGQVRQKWQDGVVDRVVFCTARISNDRDPQAAHDQNVYLEALQKAECVDLLELGRYVGRIKSAPLAVKDPTNHSPQVVESDWPIMVQDSSGNPVPNAKFIASYFHSEEKGSDVNLATRLLQDVFEKRIDAAMVFSNDSDLKLPVIVAREHIPVGVVNPSGRPVTGDLRNSGDPERGDWFVRMASDCFTNNQLPPLVESLHRPNGW